MHFKLISIAELGPFVRDDGSLHILFWFTHIVRQPVRDFDYEVNLKHHREFPLMQSALNDLSKIYSEGSYSDFEMKTTDGTSFKVHRCILAGIYTRINTYLVLFLAILYCVIFII